MKKTPKILSNNKYKYYDLEHERQITAVTVMISFTSHQTY